MLPAAERARHAEIKQKALEILQHGGLEIVLERRRRLAAKCLVHSDAPASRSSGKWLRYPEPRGESRTRDSFQIHTELERELPLHVASFSKTSAVYKIRGDAEALRRFFPELSRPDFKSAITLGHGRYSTNTNSAAEKAQMFSTLGHNGEINSIDRLTREAAALGFHLPRTGSDSQVLDRVVESFMFLYDLSLMETLEIIFLPSGARLRSSTHR